MRKTHRILMVLLWVAYSGFLPRMLEAQQTEARADATNETAVATPPTHTKSDVPAMPSVRDVLEKSVEAVGGQEAWSHATSRRVKGLYQTEDSSTYLAIEILQKSPNKSLKKLTFPNGLVLREVCDGRTAWVEDWKGGYHPYTGAALAVRLKEADLVVNLKTILSAAGGKLTGIEKVGAHTAYVVEFPAQKDVSSRMFFDVDSGYVVRTEDVYTTSEGPYTVKIDLDDYRDVDGLKFPFRMKRTEKGAVLSIRITQVTVNPAIDDSIFLKPETSSR
jgi:zinc protease